MTWTIETIRDGGVAPADVFRLYADPSTWSAWGHDAKWARADGPLIEGGTVHVRAKYPMTYRCRISRLVDDRVLVLEVDPPQLHVVQTYAVEPTPDGARVRHALEISGRLSGVLRVCGVPWLYQRLLDREVERVIAMAATTGDGQAGEPAGTG